MSDALVDVRDVSFAYAQGGFGFDVPRLSLNKGEHVACIGPSGTGKTTLVNLITGILQPRAGTIMFAGEAVHAMSDAARRALRSRRIGMVFQEFELLEYLSARENILLPYHISPALRLDSSVEQRADEIARNMGIDHVLRRLPSALSQGERQRVAICRAMIASPEMLVCDEPTGNLDPETTERTLDLLFAQVKTAGATMFMVTHNHAVLERFDRVIDIMDVARVMEGTA